MNPKLSKILDQSTAIRTKVLPEVRKCIRLVEPPLDSVSHYSTDIIQWLYPIVDLSGFYVYPMNGITEGLNWWQWKENRGINVSKGDYQWVTPTGNDVVYVSVPSSIDGNFSSYPTDKPVALDLAYIGSTEIKQIPIYDNVERVFYSLSKSFGIRNIRTGWYFTRERDEKLDDLIYGAKYYNYYAQAVAETIISNFSIEYVWRTLKPQQDLVCKELDLIASDSVWLASSMDPMYSKFKRNDKARICLAGVYDYGS